jgi:hypothetical protein
MKSKRNVFRDEVMMFTDFTDKLQEATGLKGWEVKKAEGHSWTVGQYKLSATSVRLGEGWTPAFQLRNIDGTVPEGWLQRGGGTTHMAVPPREEWPTILALVEMYREGEME